MRAFTAIDKIKFLVVFSLLLVVACAQNAYSVTDSMADYGDMAVLRDISVSGAGSSTRIEITADKPLTFTYYTLKEPFRTVIDLSQADIGTVKAPALEAGSIIKNIDVAKNQLSAGSLVRISVETAEETEFSVVVDPENPQKLILSVVTPQNAEQQVQPLASQQVNPSVTNGESSAVAENKAQEEQGGAVEVKPVDVASLPENKEVSISKQEATSTPSELAVTGIESVDNAVIIQSSGRLETYKYFTMTKPERLVVDVYKAKNAIASKTLPINKLGIATARVGTYPDKVRVVLDSDQKEFPKFTLVKTESGIKVVFAEESVQPQVPISTQAQTEVPVHGDDSSAKAPAMVESIDFKVIDGYSRITVGLNKGCEIEGPEKTAQGLTLTFSKCLLPKKLQRPFDTSAFASPVTKLTPYQVRVKGAHDTKLLISLREEAPYALKRSGNTVYLDVKNPEIPVASASAPVAETASAPVVVSRPIKNKVSPPTATSKYDRKVYTGRRVTLEFADADIRKIFQLIAEVSNLNILVGDDVTGTISIKLVNVPWDQALDVILDTKGLGMKRDGNIVVIRPKEKIMSLADEELAAKKAYERTLDMRTKLFDINYASVTDIAGQFNSYKSERGTISVDARTNKVIVNDVAPSIEKMEALLKELDIPEKQVLIEARIVEASSSFTRDLGIQWGIHYTDGQGLLQSLDSGFGGAVTNIAPSSGFPAAAVAGGALGMAFGKLTDNVQIDLRLSAAAEAGQVRIISTPKVVTLNNKAAKISQGQMIPYSTISAEGTKTEFVEAALTLEVTPHITADGAVSMKIKASNNSAGSAPTGSVPPINKKEATTELLVQSGETTVIGGIYVDSDDSTDSGVPFLMDIPILGWLFKSNNTKKTKSELLIFITPKIVI